MKTFLIVFISLVTFTSCKQQEQKTNRELVYEFACEEVRSTLKSPSEAVFQDVKETLCVKGEGDIYYIYSHVDSQNSYGGVGRLKFNCKVGFRSGTPYLVDEIFYH